MADEDKRIITDDEIISLSIEFFDQNRQVPEWQFFNAHLTDGSSLLFVVIVSFLLADWNGKEIKRKRNQRRR